MEWILQVYNYLPVQITQQLSLCENSVIFVVIQCGHSGKLHNYCTLSRIGLQVGENL